jgi:hypothetical protein
MPFYYFFATRNLIFESASDAPDSQKQKSAKSARKTFSCWNYALRNAIKTMLRDVSPERALFPLGCTEAGEEQLYRSEN